LEYVGLKLNAVRHFPKLTPLYTEHTQKPLQSFISGGISLRFFKGSLKFAEVALLCAVAVALVGNSGFALRCGVEQHRMSNLIRLAQKRQQACLQLGLRWEADDQERQYKPGSTAGTNATVGPISGYVMDVTENESGHAQGQCHALNASYSELLAAY
jgi:hypothetical protein